MLRGFYVAKVCGEEPVNFDPGFKFHGIDFDNVVDGECPTI